MKEKTEGAGHHLTLVISLLLVILTLGIYWQVQYHGFTNLDDSLYVFGNKKIRDGITSEGASWSFRLHNDTSYWHPLTWLSHMLDSQLYGLNPQGHHFNNLLFHIASTLLLFASLRRMTGAIWRSFIVAALFALHPLNVESVAWVANRKNVLSTFFWMLTLWSYVRYVESTGLARYLIVLLSFAMGLLAKPMLVTLPFALLLLDYWPLRRVTLTKADPKGETFSGGSEGAGFRKVPIIHLVLEKIPLLGLSAVSTYLSFLSSQGQGYILTTKTVPLSLRIQNGLVSYVIYLKKMIWPRDLTAFYPFPHDIPWWQFGGAGFLLTLITVTVLWKTKKFPFLSTGWFWYIGTMFPVIGLVQQGLWPALADRFAYVPLIGLFIIMAWGFASVAERLHFARILMPISAATMLLGFTAATGVQVHYWRSSTMLFEHALRVTTGNFTAHMNLGAAYASAGREEEAIGHFEKALETGFPKPQMVHFNLGKAYASRGELDRALHHFAIAIGLEPDYIDARISLGSLWLSEREWDKALQQFYRVLEIDATNVGALNNVGVIMLHQGRTEDAVELFRRAMSFDPEYRMARKNLEIALRRSEGRSVR